MRLRRLLGVTLVVALAAACQRSEPVTAEMQALHDRLYLFDLHIDTPMVVRNVGYDFGHRHRPPAWFAPWRLQADLPRMEAGGLNAAFFGIVVNPWYDDPVGSVDSQLAYYHAHLIDKYADRIVVARSWEDYDEARKQGKIAVSFALEGAHELGGDLAPLGRWMQLGVRSITLAHFTSNAFAGSSADPDGGGLTPRGRRLICEMNRHGLVIDLAHAHPETFSEVLALTRAPVIVSHTGVAPVEPTFRNLTAAQIRAVADNGGVIGVMFAGFWLDSSRWPTVEAIVDHADVVRRLAGSEHLAIGSDFDGFIYTPRGLRDVADLPVLTQAFVRRGYTPDELRNVWGANMLRVLREVEATGRELRRQGLDCRVEAPLSAADRSGRE